VKPHEARTRTSRRVIALIVAIDLAIATSVGFAVYLANRRAGAPTAPRDFRLAATTCVPDECDIISASVALSWSPPAAGGPVTSYLVFRDGRQVEELGSGELGYVDRDVVAGEKRSYSIQAVGDEGSGPMSLPLTTRLPLPPLSSARLSGTYRVELTVLRVDLLSRYEGIRNPSAGDSATQEWSLRANCLETQGACAVRVGFGGNLLSRRGGITYIGQIPAQAGCGPETVHSTTTLTLRVADAAMADGVFMATTFEGRSETDFQCGSANVHAVSRVHGKLV